MYIYLIINNLPGKSRRRFSILTELQGSSMWAWCKSSQQRVFSKGRRGLKGGNASAISKTVFSPIISRSWPWPWYGMGMGMVLGSFFEPRRAGAGDRPKNPKGRMIRTQRILTIFWRKERDTDKFPANVQAAVAFRVPFTLFLSLLPRLLDLREPHHSLSLSKTYIEKNTPKRTLGPTDFNSKKLLILSCLT